MLACESDSKNMGFLASDYQTCMAYRRIEGGQSTSARENIDDRYRTASFGRGRDSAGVFVEYGVSNGSGA
jgi:hypothetical protein